MDTDGAALREMLRGSLTSVLDRFFRDDGNSVKAEEITQLARISESLLSTVTAISFPGDRESSEDFDPLFLAINSTAAA